MVTCHSADEILDKVAREQATIDRITKSATHHQVELLRSGEGGRTFLPLGPGSYPQHLRNPPRRSYSAFAVPAHPASSRLVSARWLYTWLYRTSQRTS